MKKLCTLVLLSLALMVGLRGSSASEVSPYHLAQFQTLTGPNSDHPWGGDQGQGGGGSIGGSRPNFPPINTGNFVVDFIVNRLTWRTDLWRYIITNEPQPSSGRTHVTPSAPATGGNHNSGN